MWADDDLRSLNGQIEFLLRDALRRAGRLKLANRSEDDSSNQHERSKSKGLRRLATIVALLCAAASVKVVASPSIRQPVAQFIYFYQQPDDMNVWERVVYGWLQSKITQPSS